MSKELVGSNKKRRLKREKGPKTVILEEPIKFNGDLFSSPKTIEQPDIDINSKIKSRDDVVVERYNPDVDKGLELAEVESRVIAGYHNKVNTGSSKTIFGIIISNTFTFFNILTIGIAVWLLSSNAALKQLDFL